jgi:hypothetical protein
MYVNKNKLLTYYTSTKKYHKEGFCFNSETKHLLLYIMNTLLTSNPYMLQ